MGLLFFLFLSMGAFAADCIDAIPPTPAACDNLYINNPINLSAAAGPIEVTVTGVVEIKANVSFNGSDGATLPAASAGTPGGSGGPGASRGGGLDGLSSPENGEDNALGNNIANGKTPPADGTCANGGGGGGLFSAGTAGGVCATSGATQGDGGAAAPANEFDFGGNFRGGYGGGAGGITAAVLGSGGGGGGALHIIATGNVVIHQGVTISAVGGKGGNATTVDGAGGGGSGGALWIQSSAGTITNYGTLNLVGGAGGTNSTTTGDGGKGGDGAYKFEDINGTTSGSGLVPPSIFPTQTTSPSLKSDISCGTLAKKNEQNNLALQMSLGFLMAMILRILSRYQKKIS